MSKKKRPIRACLRPALIGLLLLGLLNLYWAMPPALQIITLVIFIPLIYLILLLKRRFIRANRALKQTKRPQPLFSSTSASTRSLPATNPKDFNRPLDARRLPKDPLEPILIAPILDKFLEKHAADIQKRQIKFTIDSYPPHIMGRAKTVSLIFEHVLSYALQMAVEDGPEIKLKGFRNEGFATYEISYSGAAPDLETQRRNLTSFKLYQRQERFRYEMHLPTAQRLIKELGGEMGLEAGSNGGGKLWFKLHLPPSSS